MPSTVTKRCFVCLWMVTWDTPKYNLRVQNVTRGQDSNEGIDVLMNRWGARKKQCWTSRVAHVSLGGQAAHLCEASQVKVRGELGDPPDPENTPPHSKGQFLLSARLNRNMDP